MANRTKQQELLSLLYRERNGAVVESMREKGLEYKVNYGVSLVDIKAISRNFAADHDLARHIYVSDVRELRLSALLIADPNLLAIEELSFWTEGIITTEIASVGALSYFSKSPLASEVIFTWFETGLPLIQYAAIMTAAANLMHTKGQPDWDTRKLLDIIEKDKAADPARWTGYLSDALDALVSKLES